MIGLCAFREPQLIDSTAEFMLEGARSQVRSTCSDLLFADTINAIRTCYCSSPTWVRTRKRKEQVDSLVIRLQYAYYHLFIKKAFEFWKQNYDEVRVDLDFSLTF